MAAYHGKKLTELKGDALKRRIQTLAANPATRNKVPAQYLTGSLGKYAQQRAMNTRLGQPVVPGSQMTNRDLAREANAATQVQFGPEAEALRQAQASNPLEQKRAGDYYDQYLQALQATNAANQAQAQKTSEAIQGIGASGQQAATNQSRQVLQSLQDKAVPGSRVDPQLAVQASQGAQVNRSLSDAGAGTAQLMGQARGSQISALLNAAAAGKLTSLGQIAGKGEQLRQQGVELGRREGAANLQYRGKRRSEEATNVATSALAGVKVGNAASAQGTRDATFLAKYGHTPGYAAAHPGQFAKDAAKYTRKAAKPTPDAPFKYGYTKKEWLALPLDQRKKIDASHATKPKGAKGAKPGKPSVGPGSLPPAQETKFASQANQVASILQNPPKTQDGKLATRAQVLADIRAGSSPLGKGIDPRVINVGMSLADNKGALGPWGVHNAHNLGLHVNQRWKTVKGKPKRKMGPAAGPAGPVG